MPLPEPDPRFVALGQLVEAVMARLDDFERVIGDLATDVATLVARQAEQDDPPWSWLLADERRNPAEVLEDLTAWLRRVYLHYPDTALPSCWMWHPWAVEELWCLRQAHAQAYASEALSTSRASDWHERLRPGVTRRLHDAISGCDLSEHLTDRQPPGQQPDVPLGHHYGDVADAWAANRDVPLPTAQQLADAGNCRP